MNATWNLCLIALVSLVVGGSVGYRISEVQTDMNGVLIPFLEKDRVYDVKAWFDADDQVYMLVKSHEPGKTSLLNVTPCFKSVEELEQKRLTQRWSKSLTLKREGDECVLLQIPDDSHPFSMPEKGTTDQLRTRIDPKNPPDPH